MLELNKRIERGTSSTHRKPLLRTPPIRTKMVAEADVHLAVRNGTNLALLNGIQLELIENDLAAG